MTLLDSIAAFNAELLVLFVAGTWALARTAPNRSPLDYAALRKPAWAPPAWLFGVAWAVLYTLAGVAAYLVRVEGGAWVLNGNRRALNLYVALQVVLALYSFVARRLLLAVFVVGAALILAAIVAALFGAYSTTAAFFMWLMVAWLTFALVLAIAIAVANSESHLRRIASSQSTAQTQRKRRISSHKRSASLAAGAAPVAPTGFLARPVGSGGGGGDRHTKHSRHGRPHHV